jgi:hypothetical protein
VDLIEADDTSVGIADPMLLVHGPDRVQLSVDGHRPTTGYQLHLAPVVLMKLQTVDRRGRWADHRQGVTDRRQRVPDIMRRHGRQPPDGQHQPPGRDELRSRPRLSVLDQLGIITEMQRRLRREAIRQLAGR